jgi:hypothetical protein
LSNFENNEIILSIFETKFEVFINPLCMSNCDTIIASFGSRVINLQERTGIQQSNEKITYAPTVDSNLVINRPVAFELTESIKYMEIKYKCSKLERVYKVI